MLPQFFFGIQNNKQDVILPNLILYVRFRKKFTMYTNGNQF